MRADAGQSIGYGHFVRTLALADMLGTEFYRTFVTRTPTAYQIEQMQMICDDYVVLSDNHFNEFLLMLKEGDIVVLDNYFFDPNYQQQIKGKGCKLVCVDDMHDKHYVADVVINHGLADTALFDVEPYTKLCLGLDWALLRHPFWNPKSVIREKGHCVVAFGGVDYYDLTGKVVKLLSEKNNVRKITAVVGDAYAYMETLCLNQNVEIKKNLSAQQMAELFCEVEFAVLPSSTVCLEAIACGCPVLSGYYVDNQIEVHNNLAKHNYIIPLDDLLTPDLGHNLLSANIVPQKYVNSVDRVSCYRQLFRTFLFDVIDYRDLTEEQSYKVWQVRNNPVIRVCMTNTQPFDFESHCSFIDKLKKDVSKRYWAIFIQGVYVGSYYIVDIREGQAERGLFIAPEYFGKGYAKALEGYMDRYLQMFGIRELYAEVKIDNPRSLKYHLKIGYFIVQVQKEYYILKRKIG